MPLLYMHKKQPHILIEAAQLSEKTYSTIANWAQAQMIQERDAFDPEKTIDALNVKTPTETKRAYEGDYVIKHDEQFYVMRAPAFETLYTAMHNPRVETPQKRGKTNDPWAGLKRITGEN